jgi:hypothetical protein
MEKSTTKASTLDKLRTIAMITLIAGAFISLFFLFHGHRNRSAVLVSLFVGWVLSPYVALIIANIVSERWQFIRRISFYSLVYLITICSLVGYSGLLIPAETKPAAVFLVIPLFSWIFILIVMPVAAFMSQRNMRRSAD